MCSVVPKFIEILPVSACTLFSARAVLGPFCERQKRQKPEATEVNTMAVKFSLCACLFGHGSPSDLAEVVGILSVYHNLPMQISVWDTLS